MKKIEKMKEESESFTSNSMKSIKIGPKSEIKKEI